MASEKDKTKDKQYKMDELRQQLIQKDEAIKLAIEKKSKEEELVELHKSRAKKLESDIKKLEFGKKVIRMDMMDAAADVANLDRNQFFEKAVESAIKNVSDAEPEEKQKSANPEDKSKLTAEKDVSDKKDEPAGITPLDKARAEFMKKHPEGFAAVASAKKEA